MLQNAFRRRVDIENFSASILCPRLLLQYPFKNAESHCSVCDPFCPVNEKVVLIWGSVSQNNRASEPGRDLGSK